MKMLRLKQNSRFKNKNYFINLFLLSEHVGWFVEWPSKGFFVEYIVQHIKIIMDFFLVGWLLNDLLCVFRLYSNT
jgi:hypothetical protein